MQHNNTETPTFHPQTKTEIIDNIHDVKFIEKDSLKIVYLNARSINNKQEEIDYIIDTLQHNIHIILITET